MILSFCYDILNYPSAKILNYSITIIKEVSKFWRARLETASELKKINLSCRRFYKLQVYSKIHFFTEQTIIFLLLLFVGGGGVNECSPSGNVRNQYFRGNVQNRSVKNIINKASPDLKKNCSKRHSNTLLSILKF